MLSRLVSLVCPGSQSAQRSEVGRRFRSVKFCLGTVMTFFLVSIQPVLCHTGSDGSNEDQSLEQAFDHVSLLAVDPVHQEKVYGWHYGRAIGGKASLENFVAVIAVMKASKSQFNSAITRFTHRHPQYLNFDPNQSLGATNHSKELSYNNLRENAFHLLFYLTYFMESDVSPSDWEQLSRHLVGTDYRLDLVGAAASRTRPSLRKATTFERLLGHFSTQPRSQSHIHSCGSSFAR